ncbi:hypothetical protein BH11MYX4_BH11MYX4_50460 [soil metagenome]
MTRGVSGASGPGGVSRTLALLGLIGTLMAEGGCHGCSKPPPVPLDVPEVAGPLVFPTPQDGWLERQPMRGSTSRTEIRLWDPKLDASGHFEVNGQTVALSFDDPLMTDAELKNAPLLAITPPVPGRTVWTATHSVELRADQPFDTSVEYTVTLPEMTGPRGKKLKGFRATFRANPEVKIAGKIIHYVPKPGEPRVVYVRPIDDRDIGPAQEIIVLYDQPIEIAAAAKLVRLATEDKRAVPLTLTHPPLGNTFEGEKVDTRSVVLAKMAAAPAPDTKLTLSAGSAAKDFEPVTRAFHIPKLPKLDSFGCSDAARCEVKGNVVRGPVTTGLVLHFTNRVRHDDVEKHIRVTPTPPKLRVGGWGEDAYVDATFAPSTTYQISVSGLKDRYGFSVPDVSLSFVTAPRTASAILREGIMVLDETAAREMFVTTRNVKKGELLVWSVPPGAESLVSAMKSSHNNDPPTTFGGPRVIPFDGAGAPHTYAKAPLDLWGPLEAGHTYLAQARVKDPANGAEIAQPDLTYAASKPSVPLFLVAGKDTVGAHVHTVSSKALVSVFRLATGEPVAGATVGMGSARSTSNEQGVALLDLPASRADAEAVTLKVGAEETIVPLDKISTSASDFYPALTAGDVEGAARDHEVMGVLVTDRGIYRPGSRLSVKGIVRKADDKRIAAVARSKVRLRVTDATGSDLVDEALTTSSVGTGAREVTLPKGERTGMHRIRLELDDAKHTVLAEENVRVADFETPRFLVDVEASPDMPDGRWKSRVIGRYPFGAPMEAGTVEWTLKKKARPIESKKLEEAGFTFVKESAEFDSSAPKKEERPRTGQGKLRPDGSYDVDVELGELAAGPTEVTFEADVSDSSYRHVAATKSITRFPHRRYAGLRLARRFGAAGPLKVDVAVVDKDGNPVAGAPAEARLERLEWKRSSEKAESGAVVETWGPVTFAEGSCAITSEITPKGCDLQVAKSGEYRVVARVDGRDDASSTFYAWGGGDGDASAVPSAGKKTPISSDKKTYQPGETAKVLVQSPFAEAMAILAVERGGILTHEARRFKGASTVFDVPLQLSHAPHAYAVVTLLPINGGPEATYRLGALRLPVSLDSARLTVKVTSAKKSYDARDTAEITVEVRRGSELLESADVALAVVDEGVLRLTGFHAKDPTAALHPPRPLAFSSADSRQLLFRRREKAHVAGGGGGEGSDSFDTRRDFVETAAWLPNLTTNKRGQATASVKLPDNLTEFRMMATVIGEDGSAGAAESSFVVTRPFLLDPILPPFALKGDKLEIAAMAHNNTDAAVSAKVTILGQTRDVRIAAHGHERVAVPFVAETVTAVSFLLEVDGKVRDKVEKTVRLELPGTEEHPQLAGVFRQRQEITLAIPGDAIFEDDAKLTLRTGAALYPELGQRLAFLREYPHGCVEQTTSGTLPLLAARNLLPWTGVIGLEDAELRKRIAAGVKHLATMKTGSGGLAYWPGGNEPNLYGTTYAARALLRAKEIGIEEEGLLPDALTFLEQQLPREREPVTKVAVAEVLAQAGRLKPDAADALYDVRANLDVYGLASLALALSTLPKEEVRTRTLLDEVEAKFDAAGILKREDHGERDYHYWGSSDRDRAQALLALVKLRPTSTLSTALAHRLIRGLDRYTTQSAAWSLMALSAFVGPDKPNGAVDVKIRAEGIIFDTTRRLGGDNKEVVIPLKELRGKTVKLLLEGDAAAPSAFSMEARFVRPEATSTRNGRRSELGPSVYRVYTDGKGAPVDLANVKAGDVIRVALRIELPKVDTWRATYLAVTDRLPAGFQPIQPDLATVASAPEIQKEHPFYEGLTSWGGSASHVDVRDDRVNVYFDHVYGGNTAYATYLVRATTPGEFTLPAARGELMYEPGSEGYSEGGRVVVR